MERVPTRVLCAWEGPEDLHTLAAIVGVAWLAETDILSDHVAVLPRRQPLRAASPDGKKAILVSWIPGARHVTNSGPRKPAPLSLMQAPRISAASTTWH